MKIGILADCFGLDFHQSIVKAAELGADGVQIYAVEGPVSPENMNAAARKEASRYVKDHGLEISAICGDLGWGGFAFADRNPEKIARTKQIVDLALDMDCRIITTHIGVVPHNPAHPRFEVIAKALTELGAYAADKGARFAIETGPELAEDLRRMIDFVASPGIGVNLDPANLVMSVKGDPVKSVETLAPYIVHTHAKDGIFKKWCDPDVGYGMVEAPEDYNEWDYCLETPLGEGQVDFDTYIPALKKAGYDGYLTIEREVGDDPAADIAMAIGFLKKYL